MRKTCYLLFVALVVMTSCEEEKKKPKAQQTPYYSSNAYNYQPSTYIPPTTNYPVYGTGSLRIQATGIGATGANTLQGVTGQPVPWSFQAISGSSGGNAVIYKIDVVPDNGALPTTLQKNVSNGANASISWTPGARDALTGRITVYARDLTTCGGAGTTQVPGVNTVNSMCSDYNTQQSGDVTEPYTYSVVNNGSNGSGGNDLVKTMGMGMLLGGVTGLFSSGGDPSTAMDNGLKTGMMLAMMQSMTQNTNPYATPYGVQPNMGYGYGMGTQYPYSQYPPYGSSTGYLPGYSGMNTNPGYGTSMCSSYYTAQTCPTSTCRWNGAQCRPANCTMLYDVTSCQSAGCSWLNNTCS